MRLNLGIRRRLAPLLENGRRRLELLNAVLLSLPGTPILYYGDEIGMGDNVYLGDRNGVRTPMQWTGDRNAGFSTTDGAALCAPVVSDPVFGYQAVNVEAQERVPTSLLHWIRKILRVRRESAALFGRGALELLRPGNRSVFAFARAHDGEVVVCVNNLSQHVQPCELDLSRFAGRVPIEMVGGARFPAIEAGRPYFLSLGPNGFFWFKLEAVASTTRPGDDRGL
jgi:maltose alpha-D-glucosyltransferase/alpha-amylase